MAKLYPKKKSTDSRIVSGIEKQEYEDRLDEAPEPFTAKERDHWYDLASPKCSFVELNSEIIRSRRN